MTLHVLAKKRAEVVPIGVSVSLTSVEEHVAVKIYGLCIRQHATAPTPRLKPFPNT